MTYVVRDLTFTSNTDAHSTGDVIAALQELPNFARARGGAAKLVSALLIDGDDIGANVDLVFFRATGSIGAESAAYTLSDAVAATHEGTLNFTAFDDSINNKTAQLDNINRVMGCAYGSNSLYVGLVARGSVDLTNADAYSIKLGIEW